ncbi:nucleotidyltransferase domain-containing protein [Mesorhizobium australicum]|uniref:Aminoglycoside-2''-adenylyltransferase n=1 Tax=Mesorhizobium australicum TaxID=536018 RepID=A0A1X7PZM4_9HYPH|nr:amino acid transporter [Mesorhizobium australicum]SMH57295.1 hypothetical protein SAMN02982922_5735 [Mesorhizobium australicum]
MRAALPDDAWNAWHPAELAGRLAGVERPWCVVGGWALDLWLGEQTREHEDIEFTVLREDLPLFRAALSGMAFFTAHDGVVASLPADMEPAEDVFQIWCQEPTERCWRADMMIEPGTPATWVYKRDRTITRPRAEMVGVTGDGIPYLKPAGVLLFKAKHQRAKDEADFERALPKMAKEERLWLAQCLTRLHPRHDWLAAL